MADSSNWRLRAPAESNSPPKQSNWSSRGPREDSSSRENRPHRQPIVSLAERSRSDDVKVHRPERQQEDSPETIQAIAEGRRVYLGNLFYTTTPNGINAFLAKNGVGPVTNIHISIDPFTGRCPGYCFIEFAEKAKADDAMQILDGLFMYDRPVKCRPCRPKGKVRLGGPVQSSRDENNNSSYNRWGNWEESGAGDSQLDRLAGHSGPNDAMRHYQVSKAQEDGRQLFIGGLPRMLDQPENEFEIRSIFEDFKVDGVSKRVSPRELDGRGDNKGDNRRNFCFVDFNTREEAQAARQAIDGILYRNGLLKVSMAIPKSVRQRDRYGNTEERRVGNSRWG
ncbi:hypothetical protein NHQ30_004107 [Ciborinia camelliae]|nr:hypothetical protein NHQ30_004107 [Ciborinia camelliae]